MSIQAKAGDKVTVLNYGEIEAIDTVKSINRGSITLSDGSRYNLVGHKITTLRQDQHTIRPFQDGDTRDLFKRKVILDILDQVGKINNFYDLNQIVNISELQQIRSEVSRLAMRISGA